MLQHLIDAKGDVDRANNEGTTPYLIAMQENELEVLAMLINAKADVNKATPTSWPRKPGSLHC